MHDTLRTAGHNKTIINIERLNTRLREIFDESIDCKLRQVETSRAEKVDLLLVPKRPVNVPPIVPKKAIGDYSAQTLWFRCGHEVLEAQSKDIPFVFGPRHESENEETSNSIYLPANLPPNPATIKTFVGRVSVLRDLLYWLAREDEPRKFLYGPGGSGKSTIAFEFARILQSLGRDLCTRGSNAFHQIVYLSAKELRLNPTSGNQEKFLENDFQDFQGLCQALLKHCTYTTSENIYDWPLEKLKEGVSELLNTSSIFLVIDDIDTLTTKGESGGLDFLYRSVIRSNTGSRLLYTQRGAPSASLENAIEVRGLRKEDEYIEFVKRCCEQFKLPVPETKFIDSELFTISQGIPLIIETIIALRRTTGSYKRALDSFNSHGGASAREYLFQREYDALPANNKARYLLATLELLGKPVEQKDIEVIVRHDPSDVSDSIGAVYEIFLTVSNKSDGETEYSLNPVTRKFLSQKSKSLEFYPSLRERAKSYVRGKQPENKEIAALERLVRDDLWRDRTQDAWSRFSGSFSPDVTEHPRFRAIRGYVASQQVPPKISEAREDFEDCLKMNYESADFMRAWANMERHSGYGYDNLLKICDAVITGKTYKPAMKAEFWGRKGWAYHSKAKGEEKTNYTDALDFYQKAFQCCVEAFIGYETPANIDRTLGYCRSNGFKIIEMANHLDMDKPIIDFFRKVNRDYNKFRFDCVAEPLIEFLKKLSGPTIALDRRLGVLQSFVASIEKCEILPFASVQLKDRVVRQGKLTVEALAMRRRAGARK